MSAPKKLTVWVQFIRPSQRDDPTAKKGWWDIVSYANGWRHACPFVTNEPVASISKAVQGYIYDAAKNEKSRLVSTMEKFKALISGPCDSLISYSIGQELVDKSPDYHLLDYNCFDITMAFVENITSKPFPTKEKRAFVENPDQGYDSFITIKMLCGFDEAVIYDPDGDLGTGSGKAWSLADLNNSKPKDDL